MAFYARVFGCVPVHVPEEARDLARTLSSTVFHLVFLNQGLTLTLEPANSRH